MEADRLAHSNQLHAFLKLAIQMHRAIHVFDRDLVGAALNRDIALHMLSASGALFNIEHGVSGMVVETDFAMLIGNVDRAAHPVDGDTATPGNNDEISVARHINIHVSSDAVVAGGVGVGIQRNYLVGDSDMRLGLAV